MSLFSSFSSSHSIESGKARESPVRHKHARTPKSSQIHQAKYPQARPQSIQLPIMTATDETPTMTPNLDSAWSKSSYTDAMLTPLGSPDGVYANFWGGEGSVVSSTSSCDSKERMPSRHRARKLERPFVGLPKDAREKCVSVSLVVGSDGVAQVQKEEVEVEFLEYQKELGASSASLMKRMVSSAGSDVSVSKTFRNMSLVNSTRGEVLVRSSSQQTDLSHSLPLTPSTSQSIKFVSPAHLKRDDGSMRRSVSLLPTPESCRWDDSDSEEEEDKFIVTDAQHDAQYAVQKLFDRKQGKAVHGFIGSNMPTSPMAAPRISSNISTCSACQIVFRSSFALAHHTPKCSVKQTPFASTDFFESLDMFGISDDLNFMAGPASAQEQEYLPPLQFGSPLESVAMEEEEEESSLDTIPLSSSLKRSRFNRLPPIPTTPTRSKSLSQIATLKRQKLSS